MKYSLDLYFLMSRMNRTEKAYFSKFAFKYDKKDSELIFLYKIIEKEMAKKPSINLLLEQKIRKKASSDIPDKKFPTIKKELTDILLESIHNHNKPKSIEERYMYYFRRADTLLNKNLKETAWKEINKGMEKAIEAEHFEMAIFLQRKGYFIAAHLQDMDKIQLAMQRQQQLTRQLDEKLDLQVLYDRIFRIHRKMGQEREKNLAEELRPLQLHPVLNGSDYLPLSKTGAYYQQAVGQIHAFIQKDQKGSLTCCKEMVELSLGHPKIFNRRPATLIPTISNLINDGLGIGIFSHYKKYRPWMEAQKFQAEHLRSNHQYQMIKIDLYHAYISNNFDEFLAIEKRYNTVAESLDANNRAILGQLFANCFFTMGRLDKCVQWCNELFDISKGTEVREGHIIESELLLLAVHMEEENVDLLPNLIRSFRNRFKKKNKLMSREEVLLGFTKKLVNCFHSKKEVRQLAKQTSMILEQIPHPVISLDFDFLLWLRAIAGNGTYSDLIKNRNSELVKNA